MFDILLFILGVYTGATVWKAVQKRRKNEVVARVAISLTVLAIYFAPAGYEREVPKWADIPTVNYVVSDGTSPNEWSTYGVTTAYTNVRGMVNTGSEEPVLIYNPKSYTADEARAIYKAVH